ncbi:MAG TPA: ATP-binding protein [Acidobacteriaceae bacterium]|jgi:nitrogen fixation/metabolism regulation signal transduction histidine kinase
MAFELNNSGQVKQLPRRIPLNPSRRRLNFERRLRLWLWLMALPTVAACWLLLYQNGVEVSGTILALLCLIACWAFVVSLLMEQITRPLQTLANVVSALRTDDYSFRARGGRRNDAIGDLALELNRFADVLQLQRTNAMEAMALVDRVMSAMQSPVLAFDPDGRLRLMNSSAERAFHLRPQTALGRNAEQLQIAHILEPGETAQAPVKARWMITRGTFRLGGVPHTLFLFADIGAALHEEERLAWERLVRVLGHEINNSLTPIKSIAGSLRQRRPSNSAEEEEDFRSGLEIIENRADSLNRFLQAYRQLLGLPAPVLKPVQLRALVQRVAQLEIRLRVQVAAGEDLEVAMDEDQIQQALINLVRNAAEAALSPDAPDQATAQVEITWTRTATDVVVSVLDTGPGLTNQSNLFVPFYTTKQSGSGIGLVLAQQIAHGHRGSVTLANRTDAAHGCRADLRLPLFP